MTLAKKIEQVLKDELKPENLKTVIDIAEYLKFKEKQSMWEKINESEKEYLSEEEHKNIDELKSNSDFINQDDLFKELGINAPRGDVYK